MSKNASSASRSNNQSFVLVGYMFRKNKRVKCFCQDESVICIVSDMNNVNHGRKFWGCKDYRNHMDNAVIFSSG